MIHVLQEVTGNLSKVMGNPLLAVTRTGFSVEDLLLTPVPVTSVKIVDFLSLSALVTMVTGTNKENESPQWGSIKNPTLILEFYSIQN